ncbi:hypothetical protein DFH08DRAFT_988518 [Mycena albidolilacea]|uniref:Uncharacterized protein n=1 Tax=Mycena albidolilacea TaxID=1033008 RepID=A0AAD6Z160_9AGAR|nr:hypothetical protein DFH08DRAFT_988518 [Mycena albidolilacea]
MAPVIDTAKQHTAAVARELVISGHITPGLPVSGPNPSNSTSFRSLAHDAFGRTGFHWIPRPLLEWTEAGSITADEVNGELVSGEFGRAGNVSFECQNKLQPDEARDHKASCAVEVPRIDSIPRRDFEVVWCWDTIGIKNGEEDEGELSALERTIWRAYSFCHPLESIVKPWQIQKNGSSWTLGPSVLFTQLQFTPRKGMRGREAAEQPLVLINGAACALASIVSNVWLETSIKGCGSTTVPVRKDATEAVVAFALAYGSFGDIQATLALAYRLYVILHNSGLGELSGEAQNVLKVLHTVHEDTAARMQYLESDSPLALSADTQRIADKICTELQSCASLIAKLKDKVAHCNGFWVGVLWVVSETQALVAWRVEMENHRRNVNAYLESLLVVLSTETRSEVSIIACTPQFMVHAFGLQGRSSYPSIECRVPHATARDHGVRDGALDLILKGYMFNRLEAGADYVERGDYNVVRPKGSIILRVDSPREVKPSSQFDMSIIKRPMEFDRPDLEECPYCSQKNQQVTGNRWMHW